jgi:hypothetical protein
MKMSWVGLPALVVVLGLAGCSSPVPDVEVVKVEQEPRLGEKADVDVGAWLHLDRKALAKLCDEWTETVAAQRKAIRETPSSVDLLPQPLPTFPLAGFDRATFSEAAGFSLPPYAAPGKPDSALALHYARMGDRQAAGKLLGSVDAAGLDRIARLGYEKEYPIEWTRLVGLVLTSAHLKLATGDVDGATNLVHVHKRLREVLDPKAAAGPLGSALLPWGRRALHEAGEAYRGPKRKKKDLADDIDKALAAWGDVPASVPALVPGASRAGVSAVLGSDVRGNSVVCDTPEAIARAFDVLTMPLPAEGVQAIVAFFDADKLTELQFAYRAKIDTLYPTPADVAYLLLERKATRSDLVKQPLQQESFTLAGLRYEVTRTDRSPSVGCLVRVVADKGTISPYKGQSMTRFGPVDLNLGYESNRVRVALRRGGPSVAVEDAGTLKRLAESLHLPAPSRAVVSREKDRDLIETFQLAWTADDNAAALQRLLPPLWAAFGPAAMADADDALSFSWRRGDNEVQLRLPYGEQAPTLTARDLRPTEKQADRLADAGAAEAKERQARVAEGKAEERLPRSPGIANELSLAGLRLGQDRAAAVAALPKGKDYKPGKGDDWAGVAILSTPTPTATAWLRQIRLRFADDKLSEIRLFYQPGPTAPKKGQTMLDQLTDATAGAPEVIAPRWAGLWADLPAPGKTASYQWADDRTIRTYSEDAGGMEIVLRDRSDKESDPWQWLSTGVDTMRLGATGDAVRDGSRNLVLTKSDGASVYRGPKDSPYEMVLVYYGTDGKAACVVAVHREIPPSEPKEVTSALNRVWGKDIGTLGFLRRQLPASGSQLGAYYWNDDRVRIRTWAEASDKGPRLRTEWRYWPIGTK